MMNSKPSSSRPLPPVPKGLIITFLILAAFGFTDATYLTVKHFQGEAPTCTLLEGCGEVTGSRFAAIGPVPLALLGAIYYLILIGLTLASLDTGRGNIFRIAAFLTIGGFLAALVLVFLQLFVIHAICLYCMASALISTLLFILGLRYIIRTHRDTLNQSRTALSI